MVVVRVELFVVVLRLCGAFRGGLFYNEQLSIYITSL